MEKETAENGGSSHACLVFLLNGCSADTGAISGSTGSDVEAAAEDTQETKGDPVEKEELEESEETLQDNKAVYADDDETSVVTMYLTVSEGNAADHTNHTWTEINSLDNYYYEDNNLDRYNCEASFRSGMNSEMARLRPTLQYRYGDSPHPDGIRKIIKFVLRMAWVNGEDKERSPSINM